MTRWCFWRIYWSGCFLWIQTRHMERTHVYTSGQAYSWGATLLNRDRGLVMWPLGSLIILKGLGTTSISGRHTCGYGSRNGQSVRFTSPLQRVALTGVVRKADSEKVIWNSSELKITNTLQKVMSWVCAADRRCDFEERDWTKGKRNDKGKRKEKGNLN